MKQKIKILTILFIVCLFMARAVEACMSPTDLFAVEVLLNKPGINYDLSQLKSLPKEQLIQNEGKFYYQSHFLKDIQVILSEFNNNDEKEKSLDVRVQIPVEYRNLEGEEKLVPTNNLNAEKFDYKAALKTEVNWLIKEKIIKNLTPTDIEEITNQAGKGMSGNNAAIRWGVNKDNDKTGWFPYYQIKGALILRDGIVKGCGSEYFAALPENKILNLGSSDEQSSPENSQNKKQNNVFGYVGPTGYPPIPPKYINLIIKPLVFIFSFIVLMGLSLLILKIFRKKKPH